MSDKQPLRESSMRKSSKPGRNRRKSRHVLINVPDDANRPYKIRTKVIVCGLILLVLLAAICGFVLGKVHFVGRKGDFEPPDPIEEQKPSASHLHVFQRAAVCTDAPLCSQIGRQILENNGSAVDSAIAAMFCNGLLNQQSMGLGGGFFMTVYIKDEKKAYVVNAREKAPAAATQDMFKGNVKEIASPRAIGVPGELRGMWAAYQRWGRLPWKSLVAPSIEICNDGFPISLPLHDALVFLRYENPLKKLFINPSTGKFYKPGTVIKPNPALCKTLMRIAEKGGDDLYNGSLARDFLEDLQRAGSIITAEDLRDYNAQIKEPIAVSLLDGDTFYTPPPPSSGAILVNILNILRGYNFNESSISTTEDKILTYHRILEAFKYAYAARTKLGDVDYLHIEDLLNSMISPERGAEVRTRINDTATSNDTAAYGATEYTPPDAGTAHISIIAGNGDAVSVTSSINLFFGASFATLNTGIIMNNVMDDFSSPGITNYFGLQPSPANFIAPGKRPLSSMSPSIIVDRNDNAKLVIGASGGTKITTAIALVTMRKLWFNQSIKEAVDASRFHHQIFPMVAEYEFGITEDVLKGLKAKGHGIVRYRGRGSIVCALFRNQTAIYGNADFRKGGDVVGMD